MTRGAYLRTAAFCLRTARSTCEQRMLRTLGENEQGVPARSLSGWKGDITTPPQPKTSRGEAGFTV